MGISKEQKAAAGVSLAQLGLLVQALRMDPSSIKPEGFMALRAVADHAGREAAAQLDLPWEGEKAEPHDRLDWLDLLVYVGDPF